MAITKKGKKWYVYTYNGLKPNGKQDIVWSPGFDTEDEAKDHEARIRLKQAPIQRSTTSLIDYLEQQWLPSKCMSDEEYLQGKQPPKGKIGYETKRQYESFCNNIRKHPIGAQQLCKLMPLHLEKYKAWRLAGNEELEMKAVLPSTVTAELKMIRQALSKAKSWKLIFDNPMDGVDLLGSERSKKIVVYDETLIRVLLARVQKERPKIYAAIALATGAGLREAEVCGLRISSVDLDNSLLTINGITKRIKHGPVIFCEDTAKTEHSKATIPIDDGLKRVLRQQKAHQEQLKIAANENWRDNIGLFFTHDDGSMWEPVYLSHAFTKYIKKSGLPYITFHELRHTHAVYLRDKGVDVSDISDRLRHYDSAFTQRVYAHKTRKTENKAIKALSGLI